MHLQLDLFEKEETSKGNKYGVCLVNLFSKYLWVKAVPSKEASGVISLLQSVVHEHGCFAKLQTDNALELSGSKMTQFCAQHNISMFVLVVVAVIMMLLFVVAF